MPSNVILVFDGLDELRVDEMFLPEEVTVNGHNDVTHVLGIFKQLVKGQLPPGATVRLLRLDPQQSGSIKI